MIDPRQIAIAAGELATDLASYLRRALLPPAPVTTPVSNSYTPPFTGGQCTGATYAIDFRFTPYGGGSPFTSSLGGIEGAISSIGAPTLISSLWTVVVTDRGGVRTRTLGLSYSDFYPAPVQIGVRRTGGGLDNCGNLPNPESPPPVPSDGLGGSAPPSLVGDEVLVVGAPIVAIPSLGGALAAVLAALRAAGDALAIAAALADAIELIGDVIDAVKDWLDDESEDEQKHKTVKYHNYGSVRKDGFLRLFPSAYPDGFEPQYIDLQLLSIPVGYGKYFGNLSPNFYRFKTLGHISFVSSSFGILSTHEIEFSRTSINVPPNALGFYYHIGLEDVIRANVSLFYSVYES